MAVAFESYSAAGISSTVSFIAASKPTGLAEGDLMVACAFFRISGMTDISPPAGWTTITSESSGIVLLKTFYKVADSSDVAASTFSFARAGSGTGEAGVQILRFSGYGILAGSSDGGGAVGSGDSSDTIPTFTPTRSNTVMAAFYGLIGPSGTYNITNVALTTNNPTWTSRGAISSGTIAELECYTASRPESTATGTITFSFVSPGASAVGLGAVIAIAPVVNGSITPTTTINAYALNPIQSAVIDGIVDQPTFDTMRVTQWSNTTKPTTTWTNPDK